MGFPVGYSEFPSLFLHVLCLLGYVRCLVSKAFVAVGLGDLLDTDVPSDRPARRQSQQRSALVEEALPVVRFEELQGRRHADGCAVCLHAFERSEEVRRLSNCRHVFHRCCLDPWMDHGNRTCPLCRAALFGEEVPEAVSSDGVWPADDFLVGYPSDQLVFS